jgi:primosomal protein N' (replication factor Y)
MTTDRARQLRRDATEPERRLWAILYSLRQLGHHFRRQHPIGPYYADFACVRAKLVIEADGVTHVEDGDVVYDRQRDDHIRAQGFRVLRFWNNDIMANPDGVYRVIADALSALTPTPDPSPSSGGGRPRRRKLRTGLRNLAARTGDE